MAADFDTLASQVVAAFGESVEITYHTLSTLDTATGRRTDAISTDSVTGEVSRTRLNPDLDGSGLVEECVVRLRAADLTSVPSTTTTLVVGSGDVLQVVAVERTMNQTMYELTCRRKF